ncbi:hypothetical protein MTO96_038801 [Rhipicephalus appendiculatus]
MKAAPLIKASLKKTSELGAFVRLAGMVKYGVTCRSRDDASNHAEDSASPGETTRDLDFFDTDAPDAPAN